MLLVVGTDHLRDDHLALLDAAGGVSIVTSIEAARERCRTEDVDAVIVDHDLADSRVEWFVWDLRHGDVPVPRVPVVGIQTGSARASSVDERVSPPIDGRDLLAAVERAIRVGEYDAAISRLFVACRRGLGRRQETPDPVRKRADECLRALDACDERLPFERLIDA